MSDNWKESLTHSIKKERQALELRIKKAENYFDDNKAESNNKKAIRCGFTMLEKESESIDQCIKKMTKFEINTNRSEIVRTAISILNNLSLQEIKKHYDLIEKLEVGRKKK